MQVLGTASERAILFKNCEGRRERVAKEYSITGTLMDIGFPTTFPGFSPRFSETGKEDESRA